MALAYFLLSHYSLLSLSYPRLCSALGWGGREGRELLLYQSHETLPISILRSPCICVCREIRCSSMMWPCGLYRCFNSEISGLCVSCNRNAGRGKAGRAIQGQDQHIHRSGFAAASWDVQLHSLGVFVRKREFPFTDSESLGLAMRGGGENEAAVRFCVGLFYRWAKSNTFFACEGREAEDSSFHRSPGGTKASQDQDLGGNTPGQHRSSSNSISVPTEKCQGLDLLLFSLKSWRVCALFPPRPCLLLCVWNTRAVMSHIRGGSSCRGRESPVFRGEGRNFGLPLMPGRGEKARKYWDICGLLRPHFPSYTRRERQSS